MMLLRNMFSMVAMLAMWGIQLSHGKGYYGTLGSILDSLEMLTKQMSDVVLNVNKIAERQEKIIESMENITKSSSKCDHPATSHPSWVFQGNEDVGSSDDRVYFMNKSLDTCKNLCRKKYQEDKTWNGMLWYSYSHYNACHCFKNDRGKGKKYPDYYHYKME